MRENFIACPVFNRIRFDEGAADSSLFIATFKSINRSKLSGATLRSNPGSQVLHIAKRVGDCLISYMKHFFTENKIMSKLYFEEQTFLKRKKLREIGAATK